MDTKRQWVLITALVGVAILLVGFMFVVRPQYHKSDSLHAQARTVAKQTDGLRAQLAGLQNESNKLKSEQASLNALAVKFPSTEQLPVLTKLLQDAAVRGHVDLTTLAPGSPAAVTAANAPASSSSAATSSTAGTSSTSTTGSTSVTAAMEQIPLTMTVSGSYYDLENFFKQLENLKSTYPSGGLPKVFQRAVLVDGFAITYQGTPFDATKPGSGELTVSVTARTFMTTAPLTSTTTQ